MGSKSSGKCSSVLYQAHLAPETAKSCRPAMIFVSDSQNLESENLTRKVKNMAKIKKHLFFIGPKNQV